MATSAVNNINISELEDETSCPICLDLFDDPRILPCSHTICYKCIKQGAQMNGSFACPLKDDIIISKEQVDQLPLNRAIKNIIERLKKNKESQPKVITPKPISNEIQQATIQENRESLNLSVIQGLEKTQDFHSASYGYQFRLNKTIRLLSVEVKVNVHGPVTVFITNYAHKILQKSTSQSTAGLKWLKIPIRTELKDKYHILIHSPIEYANFAFKYVKSFDWRPINEICSIASGRTAKVDEALIFNVDCRSIEMHIDIER